MAKGGKVQALTEAVNALDRELVKTKTQLELKESSLKEDKKRLEGAKTAMKEVSAHYSVHLLVLSWSSSKAGLWTSGNQRLEMPRPSPS